MMKSDGTFAEDISCVVPQKNGCGAIFISNIEAACNPNTLKKHGIEAVITAIKGKNLSQKIPKHIEYLYIPVVDHQSCPISTYFNDSYKFIEEQRKRTNVLVHCMAGVSRSVTLVIAYIMQKSDASFSSAFNYVKSKRPIVKIILYQKIHPNEAFVEQLLELENRLKMKENPKEENREKQMSKSANGGFGRMIHNDDNNEMSRSTIHIKHQRVSKEYSTTKGRDETSTLHSARTSYSWMKKSLSPSLFANKQSSISEGQYCSSYDQKLRQNIKKLFSQTHSRVNSIERSRVYR